MLYLTLTRDKLRHMCMWFVTASIHLAISHSGMRVFLGVMSITTVHVKLNIVLFTFQQGPSFTDGHVLCDNDSVSVGDLSPIRQNDQPLEEVDVMTPKEESVTIVSEDSIDLTERASPPKSLALTLSSPVQSCDWRIRSSDKLSPRRTTVAIVNSDSLPAVAEELPNESNDVFIETEVMSLVTSLEVIETNVEEKECEGAIGELSVQFLTT